MDIDYLGCWNERAYNKSYMEVLSRTLDSTGGGMPAPWPPARVVRALGLALAQLVHNLTMDLVKDLFVPVLAVRVRAP